MIDSNHRSKTANEDGLAEDSVTNSTNDTSQANAMQDYTTTVTILESITDAIFILNASGKIEYANRTAQEYLQLPLEGIIGLDLGGFITSDDEETLELLNDGFRSAKTSKKIDYDVFSNSEAELHGTRETIPVLINFSIIPDANGKLNYIIVTAKEIAYRKSLEKELKNRQALSVSFDRLKALGEMSVGLVHTLGQPVTSIELRLDYLSQLKDLDTIQNQVTELRKDIGKLSGIVEKVRSYAQVMADKQNTSININKTLQSILQILEYDIRAAQIVIDLDMADELPPIEANAPELEQVFINLLTNAEQAFEVNGIDTNRSVRIATNSVDNKWIKVSIQDNAGGIPEKTVPEIFEPFFSTWDKGRHAGTGLSVARSILTSLGGDINYMPIEGGSSFEMRIPIAQTEERAQLFNLIELLNS